ncbi:MAG: hypothetical protein K0B15_14405 [Lentimicrobium sp.]|nr:hypothetical protein [Lentimicrobium sp.]
MKIFIFRVSSVKKNRKSLHKKCTLADAGEFNWTGERVVKVYDGTLNVRIYTDTENEKVEGLSEIVFQRAY